MASLYTELKRRNVFRVAVAYVVVGWVVLQVAEITAPLMQLPDWTVPMALFFGIVGFPFAIVFAWAFELTPEGLRRTEDVHPEESITAATGANLNRAIIGLLALAVTILLADKLLLSPERPATDDTSVEAQIDEAEAQGPKSIAVLPFVNMSPDPEQEYFSDGISEELLNGLSRIEDLRVAARTSSFSFKGKNPDIRDVGAKLNVETVLEGSVRKSGSRVRITAQLINVEDGYHLWSDTYDRELTDIFAIQDEISAAIVDALKVHLTDEEMVASRTPIDLEAYNYYLQAQHNQRLREEQKLELAETQYRRALEVAPDYAEAWAGLSVTTYLLSENYYGARPIEPSLRDAQTQLDQAFAINPELPQAHAVQALIDLDKGDPFSALKSLDRAIAANPNEGILHAWRGSTLHTLGRFDEGTEAYERAFRIDPLHPATRANVVSQAIVKGDHARARELATPGSLLAYEVEQSIANYEGRYADQISALHQMMDISPSGTDPRAEFLLSIVYFFSLGNIEEARKYAPPTTGRIFDAILTPGDAIESLRALPADQQNVFLENGQAFALILLDRCSEVLSLYADRNYPTAPVWGDLGMGMNNVRLANRFAWCLKQTGRQQEAEALALRLKQYIEESVANGAPLDYFRPLAEVQMVLGEHDDAMGSIKHAWQIYQFDWVDLQLPWYDPLRERQEFRDIHRAVMDHMNAERSRLGWEPIEMIALR